MAQEEDRSWLLCLLRGPSPVIAVLIIYFGCYAACRVSGILTRRAFFYNHFDMSGHLAPDAGWRNNKISADHSGGRRLLDSIFWLPIQAERVYWRRYGPPPT